VNSGRLFNAFTATSVVFNHSPFFTIPEAPKQEEKKKRRNEKNMEKEVKKKKKKKGKRSGQTFANHGRRIETPFEITFRNVVIVASEFFFNFNDGFHLFSSNRGLMKHFHPVNHFPLS
jgi:hypothetical protein